jgi:hypothetical protein
MSAFHKSFWPTVTYDKTRRKLSLFWRGIDRYEHQFLWAPMFRACFSAAFNRAAGVKWMQADFPWTSVLAERANSGWLTLGL